MKNAILNQSSFQITSVIAMEGIKQLFESSTIHGLYHISSATRLAKVFWLIIVFGGFSGAGILIYESFNNWQQSPISTTIETLPISQITLPNLTVCPPKNSFLNLNHDIQQSKNIEWNNDTREELFDFALDVIQFNSM